MATKTNNRGSITVQYEDFKPISEWKEEEGAHIFILLLHLPDADFQKEQMKITYVHSTGRIRVVGERPVNNNKCKRFNEAFSVPQNCNVQKIHAKFQNSTLTIIMPKTTPTIPTKHSSSASTTPTKQSANDNKLQNDEIKGLKPKDPQISEAQAPPTLTDDATDEKKAEEQIEENNGTKRKESSAASSKESIKKRKEANDSEKEKEDLFGEKVKNVTSAAKKTVMGFARELSEDKQSLVNISVAVLVIAALGAYISYNYGSWGNSKD